MGRHCSVCTSQLRLFPDDIRGRVAWRVALEVWHLRFAKGRDRKPLLTPEQREARDTVSLLEGHQYGLCVEAWEDFLADHGLTPGGDADAERRAWNSFLWLTFPEKFASKPATDPTATRPGTRRKVDVMAERRAKGQDLFHRADAPMDDFDVARIPILCAANSNLLGWEIVEERTKGETGCACNGFAN